MIFSEVSGAERIIRWHPGWSRYFSGKKLIAGALLLRREFIRVIAGPEPFGHAFRLFDGEQEQLGVFE
jgi:hypothetical protein